MTADRIPVRDSYDDILEAAHARGWTDGLPIVPPTENRVARMMSAVPLPPDHVVAMLPPRWSDATVEKLAINAVMAGCLPEYFPIIVEAIEACADPRYELYGLNTTTNPVAPMLVLNGPVRQRLGINCSWGVLGPGNRANATIGRAVSLIMSNIAGRIPGEVCKATYKIPGAFSMCVGEFEERNPWEPLHVEAGLAKEQSAVTVAAPSGTFNIMDMESKTPEDLLFTMAASLIGLGSNNIFPFYGLAEMIIMLCPNHAEFLAKSYTKRRMQEELVRLARVPRSLCTPNKLGMMQSAGTDQIEGEFIRVAARPEQFRIFVAGGLGGLHTCFFPTYGDSLMVTRPIRFLPASS